MRIHSCEKMGKVAALLLALLLAGGASAVEYTYVDVGLGFAYGGYVNDLGQVASMDVASGDTYIYDHSTASTTVIAPAGSYNPAGINNAGWIYATKNVGGTNMGHVWSPDSSSWVFSHQGYAGTMNETYAVWAYSKGGFTSYEFATGLQSGQSTPNGEGVNPRISRETNDVGLQHWVWTDSTSTWTDVIPYAVSGGVNDSGNLAGVLNGVDPYFYDKASDTWTYTTELDANSATRGINNADQVIGYSYNAAYTVGRGFVWDPTNGLRDLNDPAVTAGIPAGYRIELPNDINELGWISGNAIDTNTGNSRTFLLISSSPLKNRGDVTEDDFVGADDLVRILSNWGASGAGVTWGDGDCAPYNDGITTGDQFVGADDYVEVLTYWGTNYGTPEPTPEPATMLVMALGTILSLLKRRA